VLRGFRAGNACAGRNEDGAFSALTPKHLALYDRNRQWTVEPGRFTVMVGASSEDIRLRGNFTITRPDGSAPEEAIIREVRVVDPL